MEAELGVFRVPGCRALDGEQVKQLLRAEDKSCPGGVDPKCSAAGPRWTRGPLSASASIAAPARQSHHIL